MQRNQIQKIEGLDSLAKLQKLYLEDNEIGCVENLQSCTALQELHLSRQRLPGGLQLAFDPDCLQVYTTLLAPEIPGLHGVHVNPSPGGQHVMSPALALGGWLACPVPV